MSDPTGRLQQQEHVSGWTDHVTADLVKDLYGNILAAPQTIKRYTVPDNVFGQVRDLIGESVENQPALRSVADARVLGLLPVIRDAIPLRIGQLFGLPLDAAAILTNKLYELGGVLTDEPAPYEEIQTGVMGQGAKPKDVTDPHVDLNRLREQGINVELTSQERRDRTFAYMWAAAGAQSIGAMHGGMQGYIERGWLAAPETPEENVAMMAGAMLADMGITLPLIPLGAPAAEAIAGRAATSTAGKALLNRLGVWATEKWGPGAGKIAIDGMTRGLAQFGLDLELGAAFGGMDALRQLETEAGKDMTPLDAAAHIVTFTVFGGVLGGMFNAFRGARGAMRLNRMQGRILTGPDALIGQPIGFEAGGKRIVGRGPNGGAQWKEILPDGRVGKFAKAPSADEIAAALERKITDAKASTATVDAALGKAPTTPMPPGLEGQSNTVQTLAVLHRKGVDMRLAKSASPEVMQQELGALRALALDITLPDEVRLSALGKARAIEQALGQPSPEGMVPYGLENEAVAVVQRMPEEQARAYAARVEPKDPVLAERIRGLLEEGFPARHRDVLNRKLAEARLGPNRGVTLHDDILLPDGRRVVVVGPPQYGLVIARERGMGTGRIGPVETVDLEGAQVVPRAGKTVKLNDGTIAEVKTVDPVKGEVVVKAPGKAEQTVNLSAIDEVGHDPRVARMHQKALKAAQKPSTEAQTPVPPAPAVTPEGEPVTVVAVGPKGTTVRTRGGKTRTVKTVKPTKETGWTPDDSYANRAGEAGRVLGEREFNNRVQQRAEALRKQFPESDPRTLTEQAIREVVDETVPRTSGKEVKAFAPGTRPDTDHRILYFTVADGQAEAFEQAYAAGTDLTPFLRGGVHVLPPEIAREGLALYAVELPAAKLPNRVYTVEAKAARNALQGKATKLSGYRSEVGVRAQDLAQADVYRVPDALHAKAMRPESSLASMTPEQRTTYLRGLLDFNDNIDTPVAEATTKVRRGKRRKTKAVKDNKGEELKKAEKETAEGTKEVVETVVADEAERQRAATVAVLAKIVDTDVQSNTVISAAMKGNKEALDAAVSAELAAGKTVVFIHSKNPGMFYELRQVSEGRFVGRMGASDFGGKAGRSEWASVPTDLGGPLEHIRNAGFEGGLHHAIDNVDGLMPHESDPWLVADLAREVLDEEVIIGTVARAEGKPTMIAPTHVQAVQAYGEGAETLPGLRTDEFITNRGRILQWDDTKGIRSGDWKVPEVMTVGEARTQGYITTPTGDTYRVYRGERLAASDEPVWRLVAAGRGTFEDLQKLGFREQGPSVSNAVTGEGLAGAKFGPEAGTKLGANLYKEELGAVSVREGVQNMWDATYVGAGRTPGNALIHVDIDPYRESVTFTDNGTGMAPEVALNQFLDPFASAKPEGAAGGYGIAMVGILSRSRHFKMETRALVDGKLMETIIEGSGKEWWEGKLRWKSREVTPDDVQWADGSTGTHLDVEYERGLIDFNTAAQEIGKIIYYSDLPITGSKAEDVLRVSDTWNDWNTAEPYNWRDKPLPGAKKKRAFEQDILETLDTPEASGDLRPGSIVGEPGSVRVHVLNNGLYQFTTTYSVVGAGEVPKEFIFNVKPKIKTTADRYPFTTSRDALKGPIEDELGKAIRNVSMTAARKKGEQILESVVNAPKLTRAEHSSVIDPSLKVDKGLVKEIAKATYAGKLAAALERLYPHTLERVKTWLLSENVRNVTFADFYGNPVTSEFGGLEIGHNTFGFNMRGKGLWEAVEKVVPDDSPLKQGANRVQVNPWMHYLSVRNGLIARGMKRLDFGANVASHEAIRTGLVRRHYSTLIHEALHDAVKGHNETYTSAITRVLDLLMQDQGPVIRKALAELDAAWAEALRDPVFYKHLDALTKEWRHQYDSAIKGFVDEVRADLPDDAFRTGGLSGGDVRGRRGEEVPPGAVAGAAAGGAGTRGGPEGGVRGGGEGGAGTPVGGREALELPGPQPQGRLPQPSGPMHGTDVESAIGIINEGLRPGSSVSVTGRDFEGYPVTFEFGPMRGTKAYSSPYGPTMHEGAATTSRATRDIKRVFFDPDEFMTREAAAEEYRRLRRALDESGRTDMPIERAQWFDEPERWEFGGPVQVDHMSTFDEWAQKLVYGHAADDFITNTRKAEVAERLLYREIDWRMDALDRATDPAQIARLRRELDTLYDLGSERGFFDLGDAEASPPDVVGPPSALGADGEALYGGSLVRQTDPQIDPAIERAPELLADQADVSTWAPSIAKTSVDATGSDPFVATYARYGRNGQPVRVVDASDPTQVTIEFPDGATQVVAKDDVSLLKNQSKLVVDYRLAQAAANHELPPTRVPPPGYGDLEASLHLTGAQPSAIRTAALDRARTLTSQWGTDGPVLHSPMGAGVDEFLGIYDRALDLGFADDVLAMIPESHQTPIRYAAYQRARTKMGDTPYARLYTAAKFGSLPDATVKLLREAARDHKVDPGLPLSRLVEDLWERGGLDPMTAQWTAELRSDAGFVRWLEHTMLPDNMVTVGRPTRTARSILSKWANPTNFELRKHPTTNAGQAVIYAGYEDIQHRVSAHLQFLASLSQQGMRNKHIEPVGRLLSKYTTWQEALDAKDPLARPELRPYFEQFRRAFDEYAIWERRMHLERGTEPIHTDRMDPETREKFLFERGFDPDEVSPDFVVMPRFVNDAFSDFRPAKVRRTPSEIQQFEDLLTTYDRSGDLPSGLPKWMVDDFDFWKRYKRDRYYPGGLDGEFLLQVEDNAGNWQSLAWAESPADAVLLFRDMQRQGRHATTRARVLSRQVVADPDIVQHFFEPGEFQKMARSLKDVVVMEPDEIGALLMPGTYQPPPGTAKPLRGPLLARTANLEPATYNVTKAYLSLGQRLARMEYRYKVADAARMMLDENFDRALSERAGVEPLARLGDLKEYTIDYIKSALGLPTKTDTWLTSWLAFSDMVWKGPNLVAKEQALRFKRWLRGEEGATMPIREIMSIDFWKTPGRAQKWASDVGAFQTMLRLGLSPSYMIVNRFQHAINGTYEIMMRYGPKGTDAARGAWTDAERLMWHQFTGKIPSGKYAKLMKLVEEIGEDIVVGKFAAGMSAAEAGLWGGSSRPVLLGVPGPSKGIEVAKWLLMHPGASGESTVRWATGIGAYRAGRNAGLSHEAAVAAAREIVENAHFRYDALAVPHVMRHGAIGGALGRVLLKFKPFMLNQMALELRGFRAAMQGLAKHDVTPLRAYGNHLASYLILGGLRGLLNHPLLSVFFAIPFLGDKLRQYGPWWANPEGVVSHAAASKAELRRIRPGQTQAERFRNSAQAKAYDVVTHGIPGLMGLTFGSRLGVSGQDLANLTESTAWLGPHMTAYQDWFQWAQGYLRQRNTGQAAAGALAGAGVAALTGLGARPWMSIAAPTMGMMMATGGMEQSDTWRDLATNPEGRRLMQRIVPTIWKTINRTMDIYGNGVTLDTRLRPTTVDYEDRLTEITASILGQESVGRAEDAAYITTLFPQGAAADATKEAMARAAAAAYLSGDTEAVWRVIADAYEAGIMLSWETIRRQVDHQTTARMETLTKSLPLEYRQPE